MENIHFEPVQLSYNAEFTPPQGPFILYINPGEPKTPCAPPLPIYNKFITPNTIVYVRINVKDLEKQIPTEILEMVRGNGARLMYYNGTSREYKVAKVSSEGEIERLDLHEFFRELFSDTSHLGPETES